MTTVIKQQDLKLYKSENLTDTKEGGGLRTALTLTGEPNELFDPIGDISKAVGNCSMRLLYAGIYRADNEPLLEGGFIIAEPSKNPYVSHLAFKADYNGELRENAVKRVESYSIKTMPSRMTLLNEQNKDSRMIVAYQMPDEPELKVGEIFCLDQEKTGYPTQEEYVKVRKVETEIRSFLGANGKYFDRKIVHIEITQKLGATYIGMEKVVEEQDKPACLLKETMVADSGRYYGVKKLTENIISGDLTLKVDGVFEQIIPSSEVPFVLTNLEAGSPVNPIVKGGEFLVTTLTNDIKIGQAVCQKTVYVETLSNEKIFDNGKGAIKLPDNTVIAEINYETGEINLTSTNYLKLGGFRAIRPKQIANTAAIEIDTTNQTSVYTMTLDPPPMKGSVGFSYRAQGSWYDLFDDGSGNFVGLDTSHGSGSYDATTKTVTVETGALPDVGSSIVFFWATPVSYFDRSSIAIEKPSFKAKLQHENVAPSTVQVTYLDDSNNQQTVTDNGYGVITGSNFTAKLDTPNGRLEFNYVTLPKGGAQYDIQYSYGDPIHKPFPSPNRDSTGNITIDLEQVNITPRTVKMVWNVDIETFDYLSTTPAEMQTHGAIDPYITVFDDGNNKLIDAQGKVYGGVNYASGKITFKPDSIVKIPVGRYNVQEVGYDTEQVPGEPPQGNKVYRNTFSHWEYIDAGVSMPIGLSGKVDVWFNAQTATNNHTQTLTVDALSFDLTPLYAEPIVGGSVSFELSGSTYTDSNGRLYYNHDFATGDSAEAGTINYGLGEGKITAWVPGLTNSLTLSSLKTSIDKNPVDEIVFRVPSAPIKPRSLQLMATTLQGNNIDVRADADGKLIAPNVYGKVDVSDGLVRCRFGQWVDAAGNESEIWYDSNAVISGKAFKPVPVYADSVRYNATAYKYVPIDSEIIGVDTVRFPSDGKVPIYREGNIVVVGARWHQDIGTAFTVGQVIGLNEVKLTGCCVTDADGKHVLSVKYETNLVAGEITILDSDLSAYTLPLTANYCVEETVTISEVDISGKLSLASQLTRDYDASNTFVSSMMVGGKMQVRADKPFSQEVWDNVWEDEPRGREILVKLDTKNYPIELTNTGTITDDWVIIYRGSLQIDIYSKTMGHVLTTDFLSDVAPENPAGGKYFIIPKEAFGPTDFPMWAVGNCIRFPTFGSLIQPWIIRSIQPNSYNQIGNDGATFCLRGHTSEE